MDFFEWNYVWLIGLGIIAGFLNVMAGGGSLLTLPFLQELGLAAAVANGTLRIGILFQNLFAIKGFIKSGYRPERYGLLISFTAILGSIVGAYTAVDINEAWFNKILAIVMIGIVLKTIRDSYIQQKKEVKSEVFTPKSKWVGAVTFFFVGFYGGFIQAGVGFVIIAALGIVHHFSLVKINSYKVLVVFFYTLAALVVFIASGKVHYVYGIILAIGTSIGGWLGARFSSLKGDKWIRVFLLLAVTALAIRLFLK